MQFFPLEKPRAADSLTWTNAVRRNQIRAECPSLPGCISQGKTREESLENIKDAARGYLESLKKHNEPIPPSISDFAPLAEIAE